MYNII